MELRGKLICGLAGVFLFDLMGIPFGGLIGFFIGSMLGHYFFDKPKEKAVSEGEYKAYQRRQGEFLYHVFALCAKMAKADGAVTDATRLVRIAPCIEDLARRGAKVNWAISPRAA